MSKAYICDRCGKIMPSDNGMHPIWTGNPFVLQSYGNTDASHHLCDKCFEEFGRFFENLNDEWRKDGE